MKEDRARKLATQPYSLHPELRRKLVQSHSGNQARALRAADHMPFRTAEERLRCAIDTRRFH